MKKFQTNIRIDESLRNRLKELSLNTDLSVSQIIRQGVEAFIRESEDSKKISLPLKSKTN